MAIEDRFSEMSPQELGTLRDNAERLAGGEGRQQAEAARLLPLIAAELEARKASAPPRAKAAPRKTLKKA